MSKQLDIDIPEGDGLPPGWAVAELPHVLAEGLMNGKSVPTAEVGFPVLRLTALGTGIIDLNERKVGSWNRTEAEKYLVKRGDFMIARGNGSIRLVGRGALVPMDDEVAFPDTMIRARPDTRAVEPGFLRYQWDAPAVRGQIERAAKTTAGIFKVNQRDLRRTTLRLAPIPEQRRIVGEIETQFTRLDAAVSTLKRVQANLKRARASVLKAAVEGRLVPTEAEVARAEGRAYEPASVLVERILDERRRKHDEAQVGAKRKKKYKPPVEPETDGLPELPEGWVWATLDSFLTGIQAGKSFRCDPNAPTRPDQVGIVKVSAVTWGTYNERECKTVDDPAKVNAEYFIEPGDFLFSRANTIELVGAAVLVTHTTRRTMLSDKILRLVPVSASWNPWLLWVLRSLHGREQIESLATGNQDSMRNIGQGRIRQIAIPVPPESEQERIVAEVERRLSVLDALDQTVERNLLRCTALRQSILKRAFEGKLVPQDPADEPASDLLARIQAQQ